MNVISFVIPSMSYGMTIMEIVECLHRPLSWGSMLFQLYLLQNYQRVFSARTSAGAQKNRAPADYLTQDVPLMVQEEIELQVYSLIEIYFANIKCKKLWFSLILSFVVFEYSKLYHIKKIYFYIHSKNFMKKYWKIEKKIKK